MATISILANTVKPSVDRRSNDTAFGVGTFSWQDPVHSWKAGPGECMTVENKQKYNSTSRELLGLEAAKGRLRGRIDSEKSVAISLQPARLICNVNRLQSKPLFGWATKSLSYKANL